MFKVINRLCVGNIRCITVEGDISLLKNGVVLIDEKGDKYKIRTIGMSHYQNAADYLKYADIVFDENSNKIGERLTID